MADIRGIIAKTNPFRCIAAETFDISDGFGELVNFLIGLMEFLCSITLFIPQTVMEVPGPGDNARIIHSHKVRKSQPNPSYPSGLSKE